jgi:hypothetical protein
VIPVLVWHTVRRILRYTAARVLFGAAPFVCLIVAAIVHLSTDALTALRTCASVFIFAAFVAVGVLHLADRIIGLSQIIQTCGVNRRQLLVARLVAALCLSAGWLGVLIITIN